MKTMTGCRSVVAGFIRSRVFAHFITSLILLNAVTLGLETNHAIMADFGRFLHAVDHVILGIFVIEILLRLFVHGWRFFKGGWNVFDFIIIGVSMLPFVGPFSMLRTLRIFRVLRLISIVPKMRRVVTALLSAIPGMASIMAILLIIFYIAAVMTTQIFGALNDPVQQKLFGSLSASMFTLFQLMTLEGWAENIALPTMEHYPYSWIFFVLFIITTSFAVLNLFIGIIVDAMNILHEEEDDSGFHQEHSEEMAALLAVHEEIKSLREEVKKLSQG